VLICVPAHRKVYQGDNLILKSKVKKNTTSPSWNIGVDIPVFEIKSAGILTLQVFDNRLTGEYLCGECRIDVTGWKDALTPTWQGLKNEKNEFAGQVKYSLKFMSANMVPALSQTGKVSALYSTIRPDALFQPVISAYLESESLKVKISAMSRSLLRAIHLSN